MLYSPYKYQFGDKLLLESFLSVKITAIVRGIHAPNHASGLAKQIPVKPNISERKIAAKVRIKSSITPAMVGTMLLPRPCSDWRAMKSHESIR
jgi:hypothetical protein